MCPWSIRFSIQLPDESPYEPREVLAGKDARTLARTAGDDTGGVQPRVLESPMKRAKLRGLQRNAAVVLGNVGTPDDADVLREALGDEEPLVRDHAARALAAAACTASRIRAAVTSPPPPRRPVPVDE